ncbi:hypothetical protein PROVRETT_07128 [Providencia rettgeri DSM 1131]|nr:hypothetical protein PROVRETT_07128 [Providencia rettgeri DSM 1131]
MTIYSFFDFTHDVIQLNRITDWGNILRNKEWLSLRRPLSSSNGGDVKKQACVVNTQQE